MLKFFKPWITLFVILFLSYSSYSQVIVERSKNKVIISGVAYYVHLVKKGETAYSISKAYGITVEELIKENPPVLYGVNEGQALRIPVDSVTDTPPSVNPQQQAERDYDRYIYHKLQPGETVYYLSKTYDVSENDIILSNPGIEIDNLPVGYEIAIPRREFMSEKERFNDQPQDYRYHKVLRGETLSSIADKYGVTIRELRRANRGIRFPQVGDFIRIPGIMFDRPVDEIPAPDSLFAEEPVVMLERPAEYTPVVNLRGSLNVGVLLPFYLDENARRTEIDSSRWVKGKRTYKVIYKPEEWIFSRSLGFVEMYQGILLAADTLRSLGLDINLSVFDIKSDSLEITRLIRSGRLDRMDLIIGPVYSGNLSIVASYARMFDIPVVSPVPLTNNHALRDNPSLFMASSSIEVAQNMLAREISRYYDHNIVFIHTDSAGIDQDVINFKNHIFSELSYKLAYDQIKFKELIFYSRSVFGNDSINRLGHALSENTGNIIVIASEEAPVVSETLIDIHALSKKFDLKVFGYPSIRGLDNLDPKYLFELDLMIYSPYWIDYSKSDIKQFNADFRRKFFTEPSELSYAWQGYDIAYYFISGLAIYGKRFIENPEIHNPDLLQTEFDFRRKTIADGFENQKMFPIRYSNDYEIELFEENVFTTEGY
jgi:LysM repeat protein